MADRRGWIFVVSSPSGGGKTTLASRVLAQNKNLVRSVSMTTRVPRVGEKNGEDYYFVPEGEFERIKVEGGFLEWAAVFGSEYGTPKEFVDDALFQGKDVLLVIDVQGAMTVKKKRPEAVLIFIEPPSLEELERRLRERKTDSEEAILRRLEIARDELAQKGAYDYRVVNDDLAAAVDETSRIIKNARGAL